MRLGSVLTFVFIGSVAAQPVELAEKSRRAKEALEAGRAREAAQIYGELVRALPDNAGLIMNLGLALHSAGQYREAVQKFDTVVKRRPDLTPAWLMLGLAHLKLGEPGQAIDPLRRVVKVEPDNRIARLELGDAYLSSGHPQQAAGEFEKLTRLDAGNPKAWQGLGLSHAALARRAFLELEKTAPDSAWWYMLAGRSRADEQRHPTAFRLFREALARSPGMRGAHVALADVYRATGHPDWAAVEEQRERALPRPDCAVAPLECQFGAQDYAGVVKAARQQTSPEALYWRSRAYSELASGAFARLAQLPASPEMYELLAEAYRLQGLHHLSVQQWQEALKLVTPAGGEYHRLRKELARSLWLSRQHAAARPLIEELLRIEPESAELNYELGDMLVELREADKALPYLRKAAHAAGALPVDASLARAYARAEMPEKAIPHFQAALARHEDPSLLYQLARAYTAVGNTAAASQTMRRFRELSDSAQARREQIIEEQQITPP